MKKTYLTNLSIEEALARYLEFLEGHTAPLSTERIPVAEAFGRITAEAIYARISSPHYLACAMDGVALMAERTFGATETSPVLLPAGAFVPVDTGDPLPTGTDAVVMAEDVLEEAGGAIRLLAPSAPWQHVRQIGEDVSAGDMLLPSYSEITPYAAGAMLAGGVTEVCVLARPVVGILPTGDEVVVVSDHPADGEVMDFNSAIFAGMLKKWGAIPKTYPIVPDDRAKIAAAARTAAAECDAVLLLAGTSAGRDDGTAEVIGSLGSVQCHGIAIRPGKPAVLGCIGTTPALGVPGYPVSGILVLERILRPVLCLMTHQPEPEPEFCEATLSRRVVSSLKYREFIRAGLAPDAAGRLTAIPLARGAGVVTSFVKADCLLDIPQNAEGAEAGDTVRVQLLRPREQLLHRICIVGSHDPLLDEAADLIRRQNRGMFVTSSHVGSMGGIQAIRRSEADLGGVHLLDESGAYNESYVRRYCPEGGVTLIECVGRIQGLMVRSGNPKSIRAIADLARPDVAFVNRQKGSGTRVLLDYLLKTERVPASKVSGYAREELTHTAVAAQIASETADAGLGILSAARLYGLDFIPLWEEQYDLIVKSDALGRAEVQAFLRVLQGAAFRSRLERLGGYRVDAPGTVRRVFGPA